MSERMSQLRLKLRSVLRSCVIATLPSIAPECSRGSADRKVFRASAWLSVVVGAVVHIYPAECRRSSQESSSAFRRKASATILAVLLTVRGGGAVVCLQMPTVHRSIVELNTVPDWLYAPSTIRLALPTGVRLEPWTISVVSSEHREQAALIGMFRNRGRALTGAVLTLSYIAPDGESIVRSVPNAAHVSDVPVDGTLPFRFLLLPRVALPDGFLAFQVQIDERVSGARQPLPATIRDYAIRGHGEKGVLVVGDIEARGGTGPESPDNSGLLVTLVLLDKNGKLLDVIAGSPTARGVNTYRIELGSILPIERRVKTIQVYAEASPDIK